MAACGSFHVKLALAVCLVVLLLGFSAHNLLSPTDEETTSEEKGVCARLRNMTRLEASCKVFGGCHNYCPGNPCQCTAQCNNFGNCCEDFLEQCMDESHVHTQLAKCL